MLFPLFFFARHVFRAPGCSPTACLVRMLMQPAVHTPSLTETPLPRVIVYFAAATASATPAVHDDIAVKALLLFYRFFRALLRYAHVMLARFCRAARHSPMSFIAAATTMLLMKPAAEQG